MGLQHIAGFVVLEVLEKMMFRLNWVGSDAMINEVTNKALDLSVTANYLDIPCPY